MIRNMQRIETDKAPQAIGPYSQAVKAGDFLFVSGQIPADPQTGEIAGADISSQTEQVFTNIGQILKAAGCSFADVVKTTVFMKNMGDFQTVNSIYAKYFTGNPLPARAAVEAARLPRDILVEAEVIAYCAK